MATSLKLCVTQVNSSSERSLAEVTSQLLWLVSLCWTTSEKYRIRSRFSKRFQTNLASNSREISQRPQLTSLKRTSWRFDRPVVRNCLRHACFLVKRPQLMFLVCIGCQMHNDDSCWSLWQIGLVNADHSICLLDAEALYRCQLFACQNETSMSSTILRWKSWISWADY